MKVKRFKVNIPEMIKGMTFEEAKKTCLSEGYVLSLNDTSINETYLVTVIDMDSDGRIIKSKYGK